MKNVAFDNRDRFIELGITIAALRKLQGMSQEQLAERAQMVSFSGMWLMMLRPLPSVMVMRMGRFSTRRRSRPYIRCRRRRKTRATAKAAG